MVGKKQIQIDARQFAQGMATTDYMPDGGMGTSSTNLNPIKIPGMLSGTYSEPTSGDALLDQILASCEDPRVGTSSTQDRILVDDSGNIYALSGDIIDLQHTPASSSGYTGEITDMWSFDGAAYITKVSNIVRATVSGNTWTEDETWWTGTEGHGALQTGAKHPMVVFENFLWFGDGNDLHNVDDAGDSNEDVLSIGSNERIECLGIDPASGLMMMGVTTVLDSGNDQSSLNYIQLYDGYSAYVRRKIPIVGKPTSFTNVGGQVFVGADNTINLWNNSGITFLRRLMGVNADFQDGLPYRTRVTAAANFLIVVQEDEILAYGDIANGKKVWFPLYQNAADGADIDFVTYYGNDQGFRLLINFSDTSSRLIEPFSTSSQTAAGTFFAPFYNFERPIFVRRVRVFTTNISTTAGTGAIGLIDEVGQTRQPTVSAFVVGASVTPRRVFDFDFGGLKVQSLQPFLTFGTQAFDFIRMVIYYDVAE